MDYLIEVQHAHVPRGLGTKGEILLRSVPFLGLRTISALILDSDICHYHYASRINSLSFRITFPIILIVPGPRSETR